MNGFSTNKINLSSNHKLFEHVHALVVSQRGTLLAEGYFSGHDELWGEDMGKIDFNKNTLHDIRSITKSIISILYGLAMKYKNAPNLKSPIIEHFPEYRKDNRFDHINIEHALTMTMGIEWNESYSYHDIRNDEIGMELAPDRYRYIFSKTVTERAGETWCYSGGNVALLGRIIEKYTHCTLPEFANEVLFTQLGIHHVKWHKGKDGVASAASGLRLTARDLLKIGLLILNKGQWEGKDIIPATWLKESMKPRFSTGTDDYGYLWYMGKYRSPINGNEYHWHAAFGNGGQILLIIPQLESIIVIFSGRYNNIDIWDNLFLLLEDFIFPKLVENF
ncbi:serine hydrolase domain-containing protein [Xenorhabdus doucetiae]|uniref:CubicO group peptidase (Beta-lactamase class C family) n=1 Tax=Xenorhabdus doucetiae TaxID=351671 RepID=A0A068QQ69_9GAMM|nr:MULTISPECIES: serine hydrolase [Xenorhabdus]MBD2785709.1 serine hydrolase [Xenorhabdus sp. 3]MBD2788125.1 serine hydrolase [Xenorhabdus sp. DI]TYP04895.1 CubicO group peptidase (beta-lactamase class C family) [Xenorhabdus doucetiae]CDG16741.1 Putative Beta-lactamase [Xenorhabdus doucetiae]